MSALLRQGRRFAGFAMVFVSFCVPLLFGAVTGRISGTVKDPSGAVMPNVQITAMETRTGVATTTKTDTAGFYSLPSLQVGVYYVEVQAPGFKDFKQTGLTIDVNSALTVDVQMQVGTPTQTITVSGAALHVESTNTQMGAVITGSDMTQVPLNGRSFTDLLALQPGVVPTSSDQFGHMSASGNLNPGIQSVNGQREQSNGFTVNGGNVEEGVNMGTAVVPNLDSIAEFRIITNNFDAEYGNYSGGQINVITKAGNNKFHGDAFDFMRNTDMNARSFYASGIGKFIQNQFGGTAGGPIIRDKLFFFTDYQGTRSIVGATTPKLWVPSAADRQGNLSDIAGRFKSTVDGNAWASTLSQELGYPVTVGEPYYTPGCAASSACVFPNAVVPTSVFSTPSRNLMNYIPLSNYPGGYFLTSSVNQVLRDDKGSGRMDFNTRFGMLSGFYFVDDYNQNYPYLSSSFPGFTSTYMGRSQQVNLADTKNFGASMVNELRLNVTRLTSAGALPQEGTGVTLSSLGFVTGAGTAGIVPLAPQFQGVPSIGLNEFTFGVPSVFSLQFNTTYQLLDNFSKVKGTHTMKFGVDFHDDWVTDRPTFFQNGAFGVRGSESGNDWADFLMGAPNSFLQGQQEPFHSRAYYVGLYAQDSWRARSDLTVNYGVRYETTTPWSETGGQFETLVPGLQSKVFPGAPTGWVFPGDPGIPDSLAPVRHTNFAPRVGLAWSPTGKLFGGPGKTSVRASFGIFYTAFMDVTGFQEVGDAPYGNFYVGSKPEFTMPYVNRPTGVNQGQRYPVNFPPPNITASHPDNSIDWSQFEPIITSPGFWYKNRVPYSEEYSLSIQRQLEKNTVLTVAYVGNESHHLLSALEANPGNPALCMSLSDPSTLAPGSPTCGPDSETNVFTRANGQVVNGTRSPFGINFDSNAYFMTIGNSMYNSMQVTFEHRTGPLYMMAGWTWSKAIDDGSGWADQINVVNQRLGRALSIFDTPQNFVFHYQYELPFAKLYHPGRLASGWVLSGITRFASGVPVTLSEVDDNSLLGTDNSAANGSVDEPNYSGAPIHFHNPRTGLPYFDPSVFSQENLGQLGNSSRRFFHGPGLNNWDMTLMKTLKIHESKELQFRFDCFNVFNHAQFGSPDGSALDIGSTFGMVTSAGGPRIAQVALKFLF